MHDLVARLGGDEFALLLHDADERETASVVERIEAAIADDHQQGQPDIRLAIGAATARDGNLEAAQLQADAELVAAKKSTGEPRAAAR
jgi:diguanylate cyclase (GGDEF)-like protein